MKIVIENTTFDFEVGSRLLKLKHETCPFKELKGTWDKIKPMTFKEIAVLKNLEERRVGILCLGMERLIKEVSPIPIDRTAIMKKTNFIDKKGKKVVKEFKDIYELFKVSGEYFSKGLESWRKMDDCYFVKCKDTSTQREYLIWVEPRGVFNTNIKGYYDKETVDKHINAIQAIAWTIQTNVAEGNIEKIIRQGDCILIKPKDINADMLEEPRHLTEKEYRTLLVAES